MILSNAKKASDLSFCYRIKRCALIVSTPAFDFKFIRPIIFYEVKKVSFLQSMKFSLIKEFFHKKNLGKFSTKKIFPWSGDFSTKKDLGKFSKKKFFSWSGRFSTKNIFLWSGKFSTKIDLWKFSTKKIFPWPGNFSTKKFYGSFPQTFHPFNTKS